MKPSLLSDPSRVPMKEANGYSNIVRLLSSLDRDCAEASTTIRNLYGSEDVRTSRAEELANALRRLHWAFERCGYSS